MNVRILVGRQEPVQPSRYQVIRVQLKYLAVEDIAVVLDILRQPGQFFILHRDIAMMFIFCALSVKLALYHVHGSLGDTRRAMVGYEDDHEIPLGSDPSAKGADILSQREQIAPDRLCVGDTGMVFALVEGDVQREVVQEVDIVLPLGDSAELADAAQVRHQPVESR